MILFLVATALASPPASGSARLGPTIRSAAREEGVPPELLFAIGYEASRLRLHEERSAWGGRTLFDFVELDEVGGPDLERASALIEADPNEVVLDWRLAAQAAAALLAEQARETNGGVLPDPKNLDAWQGAVTAFSGRDEPLLQGLYVEGIYTLLFNGFSTESPLGSVTVAPQDVSVPRPAAPPPGSIDYAGAAAYSQACSDNYSDYSRGGSDIDMVVIHTVQGSYSGCVSWFANCSAGASAQYVVRSSDGQVTQMVSEADVAWHAGNWSVNLRSVGIEHEGYVTDCGYYTEAMYKGSAALTRDIAARQGVPLDRSHIIGHNEVPDPDGSGYGGSGGHTDPGSCWDWDYYMSLLNGESATGEVLGYVRADDIYNAEGNLVGATVWIEETGDTAVVDGNGLYRFDGLAYGTYTVHASIGGYAEGTCSANLTGSEDWCSIALFPTSDEPTGDTGADDTEGDEDDSGPRSRPAGAPGTPVALPDVAAGCTSGGRGAGWAGLLGALMLRTRRR